MLVALPALPYKRLRPINLSGSLALKQTARFSKAPRELTKHRKPRIDVTSEAGHTRHHLAMSLVGSDTEFSAFCSASMDEDCLAVAMEPSDRTNEIPFA